MELNPIDKLIFDSLQNHETITLSGFGGIDYLNNNLETVHSSRFLPEILKSIITEFPEFTESEKIKFENILLTSLRFCNDVFFNSRDSTPFRIK